MLLPLLLLATPAHAVDDVLMLGNSYTFQQDLPGALQQVFEAAGETASLTALTAGGLTLADHAERAATKGSPWHTELVSNAAQREWVVLQDQSQIPGFGESSGYVQASLAGAQELNTLVANAGADTLFFLTWGRRSGDADNRSRYPDFWTMQNRLTEGYQAYQAATSTDKRPTWIAPVGLAFGAVHDDVETRGGDPTSADSAFYNLYSSDGSHPSALGNYLAACVFYATLTGESPVGLAIPTELEPAAEALAYLQEIASDLVLEGGGADWDYWWSEEPTGDTSEPGGDTSEPTGDTSEPGGDTGSDTDREGKQSPCGCASATPGTSAVWLLGLVGLMVGSRRRRDRNSP